MTSFTLRTSPFAAETKYTVTRDSILVQTADGARQSIPLREVKSVELEYRGAGRGFSRFACVIHTSSQKLTVNNSHCTGLGRREDRSVRYRQFVLTLHDALRQRGSQVRFTTVNRGWSLKGLAALLILPVMSAIALAATSGEGLKMSLESGSLVLGLAAPGAFRRGCDTADELPHLYLP